MPGIDQPTETDWLLRVAIRPLAKADLPELEWEGEYSHFRRLYAEIFQSTQDGKALMWVAEIEKKTIIGQVFVQLRSNRSELADGVERAYIYGFRIKPAYRRNGLGTQMIQTIESDLIRRKFKIVSLNVSQENPEARNLYETLGYQMVGIDPGIWSYIDEHGVRQEVHEPAWRMEKILNEVNLL